MGKEFVLDVMLMTQLRTLHYLLNGMVDFPQSSVIDELLAEAMEQAGKRVGLDAS